MILAIKDKFLILTEGGVLFTVTQLYLPENLKNEFIKSDINLQRIYCYLVRMTERMEVEIYPELYGRGGYARGKQGSLGSVDKG